MTYTSIIQVQTHDEENPHTLHTKWFYHVLPSNGGLQILEDISTPHAYRDCSIHVLGGTL